MRGLQGHLRLVCSSDAQGRSYLREQSFRAPMHISKPHEDAGVLIVNVVNPTAGLLAGDRVHCHVSVESGARLLLTTPSASRAHAMREGEAIVTQHFEVAPGGLLDFWPELLIPQGGCRYRQKTSLHVAAGGELLFAEMLAPGRVAMGEVFRYDRLRWETDLFAAGEWGARERYTLQPGTPSVEALREVFPAAYYASLYAVSPRLGEKAECWQRIHELHHEKAWVGVSALRRAGWVVKVLAADSLALRRAMEEARRFLYASLGRDIPNLRRAGR